MNKREIHAFLRRLSDRTRQKERTKLDFEVVRSLENNNNYEILTLKETTRLTNITDKAIIHMFSTNLNKNNSKVLIVRKIPSEIKQDYRNKGISVTIVIGTNNYFIALDNSSNMLVYDNNGNFLETIYNLDNKSISNSSYSFYYTQIKEKREVLEKLGYLNINFDRFFKKGVFYEKIKLACKFRKKTFLEQLLTYEDDEFKNKKAGITNDIKA